MRLQWKEICSRVHENNTKKYMVKVTESGTERITNPGVKTPERLTASRAVTSLGPCLHSAATSCSAAVPHYPLPNRSAVLAVHCAWPTCGMALLLPGCPRVGSAESALTSCFPFSLSLLPPGWRTGRVSRTLPAGCSPSVLWFDSAEGRVLDI